METINEDEFRRICEQVRAEKGVAILQQVSDSGARTRLLLHAVFKDVCAHLKIDFEAQQAELKDDDGFGLFQTLEEHMAPEFFYSAILDRFLLNGV